MCLPLEALSSRKSLLMLTRKQAKIEKVWGGEEKKKKVWTDVVVKKKKKVGGERKLPPVDQQFGHVIIVFFISVEISVTCQYCKEENTLGNVHIGN